MTQHLLFDVAGIKLALPAELVTAVHEHLPVQSVDGTSRWFLGLAMVNGRLLPVTDLGAFYGWEPCAGLTLELSGDLANAGLVVDDVSGLSDSPPVASELKGSEHGLSLRSLTLTGDTVSNNTDTHLILDAQALVGSAKFVNIQEM